MVSIGLIVPVELYYDIKRGLALPWIEHGLPDSKSDVLTTVL